MGNCLDCLRNSTRYSPNRGRDLEEGASKGKRNSDEELASVVLQYENSPLIGRRPTKNSKQQDHDEGVAQISSHSSRPFPSGSEGSADHSPNKSNVVRRLFNSPKKQRLQPSAPASLEVSPGAALDEEGTGIERGRASVDVNTANYHQLSVVGFTKAQAHAVINYRISNGRFQLVTDVRTVPGISEETWQKVKSRLTLVPSSALIHVKSPHDNSTKHVDQTCNGKKRSRSLGMVALDMDEDEVKIIEKDVKKSTVDLNHANIHQLCCIGLNIAQAQDIVNYRVNKHGFNSIDDIKCVPGISEAVFAEVSHRLTLTPMKSRQSTSKKKTPGRRVRSQSMIPSLVQRPNYSPGKDMFLMFGADDSKGSTLSHDKANPCAESHEDVALPNGITSRAPGTPQTKIIPKSPASSARSAKSIRVATWNLQCFSAKKVANPGVLEVVCTTIIKHGFDVIAIQEIGSKGEPLQIVCNELNEPTLPALKSLGSIKKQWQCVISPDYTGRMFEGVEYNGFLWNAQSGLSLHKGYLMESFKDVIVRKPFVGEFMINDWSFALVSLHLRAEGWGKKHTKELQEEVSHLPMLITNMEAVKGDIILLGDFNIEPSDQCFSFLKSYGYVNVFNSDEPTNISAANPDGSECYDNIWISEDLKKRRCKGTNRNIVRRNLQHKLISDIKSPGKPGTVSDHCPIWAAFSVHL